jgi:TPR repeat protein
MAHLGVAYLKGQGVDQNIDEAVRYTKTAADNNDLIALDTMGYFYKNGIGNIVKDACKANEFYKRSSDLGSAAGMFSLAIVYFEGSCVNKDRKRGYDLLKSAAAAGNPEAVAGLKFMHDQGLDKGLDATP